MGHNIEFVPTSEFTDWVDGADRVTASGDNGFNVRFRTLQNDLEVLGARIADLNAAINDDRDQSRLALSVVSGDGVVEGAFAVFATHFPLDNDFVFSGGSASVAGVPVVVGDVSQYQYSQQPWTDPAQAAADGVPVIPPLSTPQEDREDQVYLDTWEREAETDGVRHLVRRVAVRVQEGGQTPSPLPGHHHLPLAILHRQAGEGRIASAQIEDVRALIDRGPANRVVALPPLFHPETYPDWSAWKFVSSVGRLAAVKDADDQVSGFLPISVPTGAKHVRVTVGGECEAASNISLFLKLWQRRVVDATLLAEEAVSFPERGPFLSTLEAPPRTVIDNESSYLYLHVWCADGPALEITHINVHYLF